MSARRFFLDLEVDEAHSRRWLIVPLCVITLVCGIKTAQGFFDDDWGGRLMGINGAEYTGKFARNLIDYPLSVTKGHNASKIVPAEKNIVEWDTNHPALYFDANAILYAVFGVHPALIKICEALIFALTIIMAASMVRLVGSYAAAATSVAMGCVPLGAHYGFMACSFGPVLLLELYAAKKYFRWSALTERIDLIKLIIALSLIAQLDWWGYWIFLAIGFDLLVHHGALRWRSFLLFVVVGVLNLIIVFAHMAIAIGGINELAAIIQGLIGTTGKSMSAQTAFGLEWHRIVGQFLIDLVGWQVLIFGLIGAWLSPRYYSDRLMVFLVIIGIPNLYLFPHHADTHEFWGYFLLPFFAIGCGLAADLLSRQSSKIWAIGAIAIVGILGVAQTTKLDAAAHDPSYRIAGEYLNRFGGLGDVIITSEDIDIAGTYFRGVAIGKIRNADHVLVMRDYLRLHGFHRRLLFIANSRNIEADVTSAVENLSQFFERKDREGMIVIDLLQIK